MTQPPHDEPTASGPEELRAQVEQTRHELGDTVEALAEKADLKDQARQKAAAVKEQTAATAAELTGQAKAKAAEAAHVLQDKTAQAAGQVRARAEQADRMWQERAPEPVRDNRTVLIAAGAGLLVACLLLRRRRK
ncbi:DUF3618 domain-containing protein [Streptomyces sp. NPDC001843]|uniref:DUF3618 domain-containing protein n=1 Tax=Streptomyces sp. NPDC001843 TaxID=3364617 RepID=UPI00367DB15E